MNQNYPPSEPSYPSSAPPVPPPSRQQAERPIVTYTLLVITVLVFLAQMASQAMMGEDLPVYIGVKANELIISGQFWRLITPLFLHGSFMHIGFNMYALYVLGQDLERFYGRWRFLFLYFLAGFAGNVFSFIFTPAPSLGASTAIFGLIGAQGVLFYRNREVFGPLAQRALMQTVTIAVINLVIGMSPGIDNWGHIGGLIGGGMFAWFGGPLFQVDQSFGGYRIAMDVHDLNDALRAGLGVAAFFVMLSAMTIVMRMS